MKKGVQTEVLRHWFGIDTILFGKPATQAITEKDNLDKFLTAKGAFLSNLFEIYNKIDFSSNLKFKTVSEMATSASELASKAKLRAKSLLEDKSVLNMIKEEIKEMGNVEGLEEGLVARSVIRKRMCAIAMDSMIFESAVTKECKKKLEDWKGKILVNASKSLRDSLIDLSF